MILVRPQLGENIGAAARAMLNCGLGDLRLVDPRCRWPDPEAWPSASGAVSVLERARVFPSTAEAVSDLSLIYASTARQRDMTKPTVTPREAAVEMRRAAARGVRVGVLFGPERTGLDNDEVVRAARILHAPLNPDFSSLNLAQAVLLVAYEWRMASECSITPHRLPRPLELPATAGEMENFYEHLEEELERGGFFEVPEKRPTVVRNVRNVFARSQLTRQEVRTLHGIITALAGPRGRRS